jgi:hypothetical protein
MQHFGRVVYGGVVAHCVATAASLAASSLRSGSYAEAPRADAATAAHVLPMVTTLYAGTVTKEQAASWVTDDVVFEDAAVRCEGRSELTDCFRGLRVFAPASLQPPTVHVGPSRDTVLVRQQQAYSLLGRTLVVSSTLLVRMAPDGRVSHFEEQWNDVPLLMPVGLTLPRRLNGYLSAVLAGALIDK